MKSLKELLSPIRSLEGKHQKKDRVDVIDFLDFIDNWGEIVSGVLAKKTIPGFIRGKTLYLYSDHPALSEAVSFQEGPILHAIFKRYPEMRNQVKNLKCQYNTVLFVKERDASEARKIETIVKIKQTMPGRYTPEYIQAENEAKEFSEDVKDEELKELFEACYIKTKLSK